jgi:hypothetical protein
MRNDMDVTAIRIERNIRQARQADGKSGIRTDGHPNPYSG